MANRNKPLPKTQKEIINDSIKPYSEGGLSKPPVNDFLRGNETSLKDDKIKLLTVGLQDIDASIIYYFENVIRPNVVKNGQRLAVPIVYGSPERWKSVQADGFYRTKDAKLLVPLIMFKRNGIEKNYSIGNKLDANGAHHFKMYEKTYSSRNAYDKFSILNNRIPVKEKYGIIIPDYITLTYECVVFTDYIEDMNKLIEAINFASDSYWGNKERYQFRARIDSYDTITEVTQGQERAVKTNFNIVLQGYIIPETINKELINVNKWYTKSKIVFNLETTTSSDVFTVSQTPQVQTNTTATTSGNIINNNMVGYLNTNKQLTGVFFDSSTCTFASGWSVAPSPLPATSIDSFTFFCNGVLIEKTAIISFTQNNGISTLIINPTLLGYGLAATDEIVGIGKFINGD